MNGLVTAQKAHGSHIQIKLYVHLASHSIKILTGSQLFLTDLLFNSPRLRFSRAQQKAILHWAKELGADVPSYDRLHKCQAALKVVTGDPTSRQESGRGNVWYLNEIGDAIAKVRMCSALASKHCSLSHQDISNPVTRSDMVFYPEDLQGQLGEVWHGTKMLEDVPDHMLSPMIRHKQVDYFVNELVRCHDGTYFLPTRWVRRNHSMHAFGHPVRNSPVSTLSLLCGCYLIRCRKDW